MYKQQKTAHKRCTPQAIRRQVVTAPFTTAHDVFTNAGVFKTPCINDTQGYAFVRRYQLIAATASPLYQVSIYISNCTIILPVVS